MVDVFVWWMTFLLFNDGLCEEQKKVSVFLSRIPAKKQGSGKKATEKEEIDTTLTKKNNTE